MMDYKTFVSLKNKVSSNERIYLLEKISQNCGFFLFDTKLCFVTSSNNSNIKPVSTSYLDFIPDTEISSVENDPSFEKGFYDFLVLKECNDEEIVTSFIRFCDLYGKNPSIPFDEFISSIIDLFQLPKEQSRLDCIGLIGELLFIKVLFDHNVDLSNYWHIKGQFSKYDFSLPCFNIEVKSSTGESTIFKIKHSQIFNNEKNIICLVTIHKTDTNGYSLLDLVKYFKETTPFSSNLRFLIALDKELKKEIDPDLCRTNFMLKEIYCFDTSSLQTISNIPFNISNIHYDYDFDLSESFNVKELVNLLNK